MRSHFDSFVDKKKCYVSAARLEVGNGVYYGELEYSESDKVRIYRDVINYVHKQNDKNTASLPTRDNFDKLFGFIYFNLTYKSDSKYKRHFEKGYTPNWTEKIFTIDKIDMTNPVTYQVRDLNNEKILGSFYSRELSPAKQNIFRMERI